MAMSLLASAVDEGVVSGLCCSVHIRRRHALNRTNEADNVEMGVGLSLGLRDLAVGEKNLDHGGPLAPEEVGTRERSVSAANDETVDSLLDQVERCELTAFGRADYRKTSKGVSGGASRQLNAELVDAQAAERAVPIRVPPLRVYKRKGQIMVPQSILNRGKPRANNAPRQASRERRPSRHG